jgi:hypothetical protein
VKVLKLGLLAVVLAVITMLALPKQVMASQPLFPQVENLTDQSFTVSWDTRLIETGQVLYGTSCAGATTSAGADYGYQYSHAVDVVGLAASTTYYYQLVSGGTTYNNGGSCYAVTTGPNLGSPPPTPIALAGSVDLSDCKTAAPGTLVKLSLSRTGLQSETVLAVTSSSGTYSSNVSDLRTQAGTAYFLPQNGDTITVTFDDGNLDSTTFHYSYGGGNEQFIPQPCLYPRWNFLANPGFESADTFGPWVQATQATRESSVVHSGTWALQVSATAANQNTIQDVAVAPNQQYAFSAWINQSVASCAIMKFWDYDTGNLLPGGSASSTTVGSWVQLSGTFSTGPLTNEIMTVLSNCGPGSFYWDDITVLPTTLTNPGFEMSPHGTMGWQLIPPGDGSAQPTTTNPHAGALSLQLQTATAGAYTYAQVAVQPNHTYTLSAYLDESYGGAYVAVWDYSNNDASLGYLFPNNATLNAWQQLSGTFKTAATTSEIELVLKVPSSPSLQTYYWDDFSLSG